MRSRSYKRVEFVGSGTNVIEAPEGSKIAVYAKKVSGSGSATLAVSGSFTAIPESSDKVALESATSVPSSTGVIHAESSNLFPYIVLTAAFTGSATVHVYVAGF